MLMQKTFKEIVCEVNRLKTHSHRTSGLPPALPLRVGLEPI